MAPTPGLDNLSFGAGARACSGQAIAHRLLYTALLRLLSCYRIVASEVNPPETDYVGYNAFKSALVAIPRDFGVRMVLREGVEVEGVLKMAEGRTGGAYR